MFPLFQVDKRNCRGCAICAKACPEDAIEMINKRAFISVEKCQECGTCMDACPRGAILLVKDGKS